MEKLNNSAAANLQTQKPNKLAVFIVLLIFISLIIFIFKIIFGGSEIIGKYKKEDLPDNFEYRIIKDESDANIEKNQLEIEINQKLTEGQIATLAEELFNSKEKQRRFYMFYKLKGVENSPVAWAISHFDPELEIEISGSTNLEDTKMFTEAKKVKGDIIGIFDEKEYTFSLYTLYEIDDKIFIKTTFKDGESMDNEVIKINNKNGMRYNYKEDVSQGEYFILENDILEFYNKENKMFTSAEKLVL